MLNKILIGSLITCCSLNVFAEEEKNWGVDLSLSAQHQEYELVNADMRSANFSPYYQTGNWTIAADISWIEIDGDYFTNVSPPRIVDLCNRIADASPLIIQRLINRGRITPEQVARCNQINTVLDELESSQSGVSDVSISVHYLWPWASNENWATVVGVNYKHDNGDVNTGLGSGSRDAGFLFGVGYQGEKWSSHLDASLTTVSATDIRYAIQDYSSIGFGVGYEILSNLVWSVDYQIEQAYLKEGDDVKYSSTYLDWAMTEAWSLRLNVSDYQDVTEYPQTEYGASLTFSF